MATEDRPGLTDTGRPGSGLDAELRERLTQSLDALRFDSTLEPTRLGSSRRHVGEVRATDLRTPEHSGVLHLAQLLAEGAFTCEELVQDLLDEADGLGSLNVYAQRFDEQALASAREADALRRAGRTRGVLHGIPVAVKDVLSTREAPTTANSRVGAATLPPGDAPVVHGLRTAGAVVLGKTTTMELACGMPDRDGGEAVPRNPWEPDHWTGGSSSGSASGVAARLFPAALGSDTAGSIRTPAALCGVTGFKPTNGTLSTAGCLMLSPDMDCVGPIAQSAIDCAVIMEAILGAEQPSTGQDVGLAGVRIAAERERYESPDVDPAVRTAFQAAIATFESLGATVDDVTLPGYDALRVASRVVWTTEAFATFGSALDTVRPPTRQLLEVGAMHSGADFALARRAIAWGQQAVTQAMSPYAAVLSPTRTCLAPLLEEATIEWQLSTHNHTSVWNLVGFPAVSVPMGFSADGLPMGLQIVGTPGADRQTLAIAAHYQSVTTWHRARPPLASPIGRHLQTPFGAAEGVAS